MNGLAVGSPGAAFRAERRARRLTQYRLAAAAGIAPETLCRFERERGPVSATTRLLLWLLLRLPGALEAAEGGHGHRVPKPWDAERARR